MYIFTYVAIQSASSNVGAHNRKILTTSFGGSATNEGYSGISLQKSRDETETHGTYIYSYVVAV